jgi:hemoglobin
MSKDATLYRRLGGYDAIAAVTDDFLGRLIADDRLGRFFKHVSHENKLRARQLTIDFLCNAAGGPSGYIGRSMTASHRGMGITTADWEASISHLRDTLTKYCVSEPEAKEVLGIIESIRLEVVDP